MWRKVGAVGSAMLGVLLLAGCEREGEHATTAPVAVAQVLVHPPELTIPAGGEALLQAQANDAQGVPVGGAELIYSSAAPELLQVSPAGVVVSSGRTAENAEILVRSGDLSVSVKVRVTAGAPARIELLASEPTLDPPAPPGSDRTVTGGVTVFDSFSNPVPGVELELLVDGVVQPGVIRADAGGKVALPEVRIAEAPDLPHQLQVRLATDASVVARFELPPRVAPEAEIPGEVGPVTN